MPQSLRVRSRRCRVRAADRAGLSILAALALVLVAATLAVVSVPRFSKLALADNERDARVAVRLLAEHAGALTARQDAGAPGTGGAAPSLAALLASDTELGRTLTDAELMCVGASAEPALRRHGYLFWLLQAGDRPLAVAWPWESGRTGLAAYCARPGEALRELEAASCRAGDRAAARALSSGELLGWPERREPD